MQKSIFSLSLAIALSALSIGQAAVAQQTTIRTGSYGNSAVTNRSVNNGVQTTTRTGPQGNTQTTNRSVNNGVQTTTRTGPMGKTQTTNRSVGH